MSKRLGLINHVHFIVETTFPSGDRVDANADRFGEYYMSAYTDLRNPGSSGAHWFHVLNPEVMIGLATEREGSISRADTYRYLTVEDAIRTALLLKQHGRVTCGWEGNESWHMNRRRQPLKVRIVKEIYAMNRELFVL